MASKAAKAIHYAKLRKVRRRLWLISPEGFRELRHSCLLSRKAAAEYLGVCLRTLRHWEAGRNRVPWSAVRLLRLVRAGELGGLDDAWEGWTISRHGLRSPCGRLYTVQSLRNWWLVIEQARFWREGYDLATLPSAAQPREATGRSVPFPRAVVGQGENRTRETEPGAIRQEHPFPAEPAFDRGRGELAGAADAERSRRQPPAAAPASDAAPGKADGGRGGYDARMTPQCSHEGAERGATLEACKMAQTASVSHSSPFGHVPEFLPLANRGGNFLNGQLSDASLTSPCKGVA